MPLHKRRAIEAAIVETFVAYGGAVPGTLVRGIAYHPGWERENLAKVKRHVVKAFLAIDITVSPRTVERVWRAPDSLPHDPRSADSPGLIRHAADMLNFDGDQRRDDLIDRLRTWCASEARAARPFPQRAYELAVAYRKASKKSVP
jgi:hypothetical protein